MKLEYMELIALLRGAEFGSELIAKECTLDGKETVVIGIKIDNTVSPIAILCTEEISKKINF